MVQQLSHEELYKIIGELYVENMLLYKRLIVEPIPCPPEPLRTEKPKTGADGTALLSVLLTTLLVLVSTATASVDPVVIEAESMTFVGNSNNRAVTDGWALLGKGALVTTYDFKVAETKFKIIARGDYAGNAWPIMEVRVGGILIASVTVNSKVWKTFEVIADITAGSHEISLAFINDYYVKPADRNLYIDKLIITQSIENKSISFTWDPNIEENLVGYKLYYGKQSRFDESLDPEARTAELTKKNCNGNQKCIDSWLNYCTDPADQMCDYDWFDYDDNIDIKNMVECTITLPVGTYFFAVTAYDDKFESKFSKELTQTIEFNAPGIPLNLNGIIITIKN